MYKQVCFSQAQNKQVCFWRNKILSVGFVAVFIFFGLFPSSVLAAATVTITNSPASAAATSDFTVSFSASGLTPSVQYYAKVRIGVSGSSGSPYTKAETKNGSDWLGDSAAWTSMPTFTTDSNGALSGTLTARTKSDVTLGNNSLLVRLKPVSDGNTIDSFTDVTIEITAAPSPFPSPSPSTTPIPSHTATPTSTPSPSPSSSQSSQTTTSPNPSPKPTKKPSPKPSPTPEEAGNSAILAATTISDPSPEPSPSPEPKKGLLSVFTGPNLIGVIFTVLGIGFLGFASLSFLTGRSSGKIGS